MTALVYALGAALIGALMRRWRPDLAWRTVAAYVLAVAGYFAAPLFTSAHQVPMDIPYHLLPWKEVSPQAGPPRNQLLTDVVWQMLPFRTLVRERLLHGEAPLWTNDLGTGQPLLGDAQSAPFAPLHLLALPLPAAKALTVAAAWQMLLALLCMHALLHRLGAGTAGCVLAALAFSWSTFAIAWGYHPGGMAAAWLPGLLLAVLLTADGASGGVGALVAFAAGMALSGHPETLAQCALGAAILAAGLTAGAAPGGRLACWRRFVLAAGLAACLCAPVLLPLAASIPESQRAAAVRLNPLQQQPMAFSPRSLITVLQPGYYGSPRDHVWMAPPVPPTNFNEICTAYAGLLPLGLALAGAFAGGFGGGRRPAWIMAGGLAALAIALRAPVIHAAYFRLPVIGQGSTGRLTLFWVTAVAIVSGLTLELWVSGRGRRWAATAALLAVAAGFAALPPPPAPWERAAWIAGLAGAAGALAALHLPPLRRWFPWVVVGGAGLELLVLMGRYQPVVPAALDLAPPPAVRFMQAQRAAEPTARIAAAGWDLVPNLNVLYGLWDVRSDDPMHPADVTRMLAARLMGKSGWPPQQLTLAPGRWDQTFLNYLGVRHFLAPHGEALPAPWQKVFEGVGGAVWRNPHALPPFIFPKRLRRLPDRGAALAAAMTSERLRTVAVTCDAAVDTAEQQGEVSGIQALANGFDLAVSSPTGGVVASSVSFATGWRATAGGKPARVVEVNAGFLGIQLPAGTQRVELRYRPFGWTLGWALCGLAAAAWAVYGGWRRRALRPAARQEERSPGGPPAISGSSQAT
ncbi:MAG: YfhO family protein [Acidobacteria bacterium]|nr:YfhO family protein [Acidobacteriota bacterium]